MDIFLLGKIYPTNLAQSDVQGVFEKAGEEMTPDGNVHVIPTHGPEHIESEKCWCEPTLDSDFTDEGGKKVFLHKEIQ